MREHRPGKGEPLYMPFIEERTTEYLIDIHTHIAPNVDDGSKSMEMSLAMLRSEAEQGAKPFSSLRTAALSEAPGPRTL